MKGCQVDKSFENGNLITGGSAAGYLLLQTKEEATENAHQDCCGNDSTTYETSCQSFYEINPPDNCSAYLPPSAASENGSHVCRRITADKEIKNSILKHQHTAIPCACFEQKMALDYSFQKIGDCYKQWFSENGLKQMCCYDAYGHLLTGPKNGGYVIPDILEPDIADIHNTCCMNDDQCKLFYETFPSNNCSDSTDIIYTTSWGDPEITTVDQHKYSFNGHGEYTFLETSNKSLQIQTQTDFLIKGNIDATIFVAFVLVDNLKKDTITIVYNRTDEALYLFKHNGSLWKNSKQEGITPGQSIAFQWHCTPNGFGVRTKQTSLNISEITFTGGAFMSVTISHPRKNITGMSGLAGNLQQGYYTASNGTKVSSINATEEQLYYYGESWRVTPESENKFNYSITGGNFTYWNGKDKTVPGFFEDLAKKGDLEKLYAGFTGDNITLFRRTCKNSWNNQTNAHCLATIARTKNETQGEAIMDTVEKEHHIYVILHNKPPHFKNNTPTFLNVTYGVNSYVKLDLKQYVADDFDKPGNMSYSVETDITNYTFGDGNFSWMVGTYLRYSDTSLIFTVNDTLGFSAAKQIPIYYCGCEDPSQCDFGSFNGNSSEKIKKAACKCPAYSEGFYCEVQLDPCKDYTCYEDNCNGSFNRSSPAWPCADCPEGLRSMVASYNQTCENIDECAVGPNPCGQICNDTDGSYKCFCKEGFKLNIDGHKCDDIDECKLPPIKCTGENEVCLNTEGNFNCICEPGYSKTNGVCKETGGSTYVGHMSFTISATIQHISEINKTIDSAKNRKDFQEKLAAGFNNTKGFLSVEVFRLSLFISQEKRVRRDTGRYDVRADYVVHWKNVTDIKVIGAKLLDSFKTFTSKGGTEKIVKVGNVNINLESAENHINNATTEGALCTVPGKTDCDRGSTNCIDKEHGEYECQCKSGYELAYLNTKYCSDKNECKAFEKNRTLGERCVRGSCYNSVGSWNCSCPAGRKWQDVGNSTYPVYRCQGNFSYIGNLSILWRGQSSNDTIVNSIQDQLKIIYTNKTLENTTFSEPISSLFVSATVLSLKVDISTKIDPMHKYNVLYNLRMGEHVGSERVSNVLYTAFSNKSLWVHNSQNLDMTFTSYYIFKDSDNILCDLTSNGNCDPVTTDCRQKNGTTFCKCKNGYAKLNPSEKFCIDIDECKTYNCNNETCVNLPGSWMCICKNSSFVPVQDDRNNFTCGEVSLCDILKDFECDGSNMSCVSDKGICTCPKGYHSVSTNETLMTCTDVDECAENIVHCSGHGKCVNTPKGYKCECEKGYSMNNTDPYNVSCYDIDECAENIDHCSGHGKCVNTPKGYKCECEEGYSMNNTDPYNVSCYDIDECNSTKYSCKNGACNNTMGNWSCNCPKVGFWKNEVSKDVVVCEDINECFNNSYLCDGKCKNTFGNWICECDNGYRSHPNELHYASNITCRDINECTENNINCSGHGTCSNVPGGYTCVCDTGFIFNETNKSCEDIDECHSTKYSCKNGTCNNTIGNWSCNCPKVGFWKNEVSKDVVVCEDINECFDNSYFCGGKCKNTFGNWTCECDTGYRSYPDELQYASNITCRDIDECTENHINCSQHGKCRNMPGGYTCACGTGFIFNETNKSCEDIDECHSPKYTCGGEGKCSNTHGSWTCSCNDFGYRKHVYSKDVIVCEDIDECSDSVYYCGGSCNNTLGNWTCECDSGYTRESNKEATIITCEDINECDLQESCIDGVCDNLDGSWTCICPDGKEPKTINSTTILCSGGYVYIATIGIAVTGSIENKDHELKVYLKTQIKTAYESKYPEHNARVEIISISKGSNNRKKRETSENLAVEFVLHFDEPLDSDNITKAWHDYRKENCPKGICKAEKNDISVDLPFNVIFDKDVVFDEKKQTDALCSIPQYNLCNPDSTKCQYINATLHCECKKGYTRKSDYECKVSNNTCNENPCQNYGSCHMIDEDTDFECRCRDGWTGKTCEDVQLAETDLKTIFIATGSSLGAVVFILAVVVIAVCRWKAAKVKEVEKMSMRNMDNNDFKSFDGSLMNSQYMRDGQNFSYDRNSLNSYRSLPYEQQNGGSSYRNHNGYLNGSAAYAKPHKLPRPNFHGSMPNLANHDAHFYRSDTRRYSGEEPRRVSSHNQGLDANYDMDWRAPRNNVNGRRSPSPDYGRPSSPRPDYGRREKLNRSGQRSGEWL
ncbi:uncharacterized protein LOC123542570 [Mercenaria mercenaria]|uniref:uncharacterized protein LOC123542570 n=1 Tax=Mercenaria mercenaria TaxID=6596 RepID=UPI00234E9D08|nr:uncharacterized protein LOC123542570 [Mercenaria mercenaria]